MLAVGEFQRFPEVILNFSISVAHTATFVKLFPKGIKLVISGMST